MIAIALFAMIGAALNMGVAYWLVYSLYCVAAFTSVIIKLASKN